jgi:hypothetical protein
MYACCLVHYNTQFIAHLLFPFRKDSCKGTLMNGTVDCLGEVSLYLVSDLMRKA